VTTTMTRALPTIALLALLTGCSQSHDGDVDAGPPAGRDAGPCPAPSITVVVRTDYAPGDEFAAINVELNDVVVLAVGVDEDDDPSEGLEVGAVCGVGPRARITARLLSERGTDVAGRQVLVDSPVDGSRVEIVISR